MKTSNLLVGLLGGLAAGAVLGVLFAPEKGSETRRKITEKGSELANSIKAKLTGYAQEMNEDAEEVIEEVEEQLEALKRQVKNA